MKFLLHAQIDQHNIKQKLGAAEYSYFFLLRAFTEVLADLGEVIQLANPKLADAIYKKAKARGESCVLLSFAPPHKTPLGLTCPTIPVFAWEYPEIPERIEETCWQNDPRNDWRHVLSSTGRAICLSSHTVAAVKRSMGALYSIVAIPSPIKPLTSNVASTNVPPSVEGILLRLNGSVADSRMMGLDPNGIVHPGETDDTLFDASDANDLPESWRVASQNLPLATDDDECAEGTEERAPLSCGWDIPAKALIRLRLKGVVYTSVLTPAAGRKNWEDLVTAFCWAFRDTSDATLLLKLAGNDLSHSHLQLLMMLSKLSPFKCRVIAIYGYLSDDDYASLIRATTFYVNTSWAEGLCLPLVEFLNAGIPAIAPDNTAMADYIREDIAFVLASYPGVPTMWPHGDNEITRTSYHQLNWQSIVDAFRDSYDVAHHDAHRYRVMSARAREAINAYCGPDVVRSLLREFLCPDAPLKNMKSLKNARSKDTASNEATL